jgi:glycerophosphoryl diester phosphodiesterase
MSSLHILPPVIAHRGASAYAPENTIAAFTKAAQLGIKWIEFDVMQASCGEPIIFHDESLDRTTNERGEVAFHPYAYLQSVDAGAWFDLTFSGERIPTLRQTLEFIENNKLSANIEIKALPGQEEKLVERVIDEVSLFSSRIKTNLLFSSFSQDALFSLRKFAPDCLLGLLLHEWEPNWQDICEELNCVSVHVYHRILTQQTAQQIKEMDKALLCYTVNHKERALKLFSWGVDAVFSDVPDKILSVLP